MKNNYRLNVPTPISSPSAQSARSWLVATAAQAAVTCALIALQRHFENTPKELYARMIVTLGIVATWSLALRTIRARLIELLAFWQKTSRGLIPKAPISALRHDAYIKASIRRLRIIAAGLTLPFFILPLFWAIASVFLSIHSSLGAEYWIPPACFMLFNAGLVAAYFHWSIVPLPVPSKIRPSISVAHRLRRR